MIDNRALDPTPECFEAWLMGTKGENAEELENLVVEAVRDTAYWRRHVFPMDPRHITEEMKESPEFKRSVVRLRQEFQSLLSYLKRSVPAFSMRYQAHMGWDLLLPGMLGYFAGMLHGSNNVAYEGAPATTVLESIAAQDLCRMLGFRPADGLRPWAHFTGGGTLSNIEGLWAARNVKFLPFAVKETLQAFEREFRASGDVHGLENMAEALRLEVACRRPGEFRTKSVPFGVLTAWELLNMGVDEALALPARVGAILDEDPAGPVRERFDSALIANDLNSRGLRAFPAPGTDGIGGAPVVLAAGTRHFSIEKAACLLGMGQENVRNVFVDESARMDMGHLDGILADCLERRIPVLAVVATLGTTEEGAVDPLSDIVQLRDKYRMLGLDFALHVDAAWGGYHASILREDFPMDDVLFVVPAQEDAPGAAKPNLQDTLGGAREAGTPSLGLSRYARLQYGALPHADTVTVDPHKQGHIPFPAGAICYRNSALRNLVRFGAPYLGALVPQAIRQADGATDPFMGIYGVEGSRPGAAAASVFLTHRLVRPSKSGYGRLIGMEMFNCKKVFALISRLNPGGEDWIAVTLAGAAGREEACLRADALGNAEAGRDPELLTAMEEMGPDLNILAYLFNFKAANRFNQDLGLLAAFNQAIYDKIRLRPEREYAEHKLIVSQTLLLGRNYGPRFLNGMLARLNLGLRANPENCGHINLFALRSTVANPWLTDTVEGSFLPHFREELRAAVRQGLEEVLIIRNVMEELKRERSPLLGDPMLPIRLVPFAPDLLRGKLPEEFVPPGAEGEGLRAEEPCTHMVRTLLRRGRGAQAEDLPGEALRKFNEVQAR
ncbi:MAG TPA: pyridoxal-dependent decarboxylase [Fibrobacteria bacterium]|nr:pyridoxal-dependent decarboxylase [Fibrobacteria bacterium]